MHIGVMSDSHNRREFIERALRAFRERGISAVFHCGDLTSPEMIPLFEGFELYLAQGNLDVHPDAIRQAIEEIPGPRFYGRSWEGELADKRIALCHGDDSALLKEYLWRHDLHYVFHGHTHHPRDERIGNARVINPGAHNTRTVCVVDLAEDVVEFLEL